jgi:hypothetical protein
VSTHEIADGDAGFSAGIQVMLDLGTKLDEVNKNLTWRERESELFCQVPLWAQMVITGGTGAITDGGAQTLLTPPRGCCWSIRRMSINGLGGAGTIQAFMNGFELVETFPQPCMKYGKAQLLLQPGDQLTFTGTGVTGPGPVIIMGSTDQFPYQYLRRYLE